MPWRNFLSPDSGVQDKATELPELPSLHYVRKVGRDRLNRLHRLSSKNTAVALSLGNYSPIA